MRFLYNISRLCRVTFIMARYGALFSLKELKLAPRLRTVAWIFTIGFSEKSGTPSERLAKALENLGPSFIKLGQALSTRPDLVGEEFARDLSTLQDRVPAFPAATARAMIEAELELPIEHLFSHFEDTPIAAASIAQVHKATTPDGRNVAVKVLRPKIEQIFNRDMEWLLWVAKIAERSNTMKRMKPVEIMQQMADAVKLEMDLRFEAAAASELKGNFKGDHSFYVPQVDWKRTSQRILVTEWVEGINIADKAGLIAAGHDLDALLKIAAECFFKQAFRDGFFHADMHPGNVFIGKEGNIIVVDFGIMGRLEKPARLFFAQTLLAFLRRDYYQVAKLHMDYGFVPKTKSLDNFAQACRSIGEPIMGLPVNEISVGKLIGQLFKVAEDFDMQTDPSFFLLHKTLMMAEGLGRMLNPNINMWQLSEPLITDWARENFGIKATLREKLQDIRGLKAKLGLLLDKADAVLEKLLKDNHALKN